MRPRLCLGISIIFAASFAGCGTGRSGGGGSGGGGGSTTNPPGLLSISVTTASPSITLSDTTPQRVPFVATGTYQDGTRDVTDTADFSVNPWVAGSFDGADFITAGIAGTVTVTASIGAVSGQTKLTIAVDRKTVDPQAPPGAPNFFGGAAETGNNPTVSTPFEDTLLPPNLGMFEFAWTDTIKNHNLWELSVSCESFVLKTYLTTSSYVMTDTDAKSFAESCRGKSATVTVRGTNQVTNSTVGKSKSVSFALAEQDVEGGIYYWGNDCTRAGKSSIYRFDFGKPKQAEAYYGPGLSGPHNSSTCVGCHSVSRDGKSVIVDVSDNHPFYLRVLDAATLQERFPSTYLNPATFTVFSPAGSTFISGNAGTLTLRDTENGTPVGAGNGILPLKNATQPDWSADGSKVVAVQRAGDRGDDYAAFNGSIAVMSYDSTNNSFSEPKFIVTSTGDENNYYPCFTPDNKYVIYNFAPDEGSNPVWKASSYSNPKAILRMVLVDDEDPIPIELTKSQPANHQRHSWPRVNPFLMIEKGDSLFWFTFSSTVEPVTDTSASPDKPSQIYMAAIRLPSGEEPVQYASFRLPYQVSNQCNHIAQWTQVVVPEY